MGVNQDFKNHEAINTIIIAIKKRICYKDRLTCQDVAAVVTFTGMVVMPLSDC